jgi:hypothetical protein
MGKIPDKIGLNVLRIATSSRETSLREKSKLFISVAFVCIRVYGVAKGKTKTFHENDR